MYLTKVFILVFYLFTACASLPLFPKEQIIVCDWYLDIKADLIDQNANLIVRITEKSFIITNKKTQVITKLPILNRSGNSRFQRIKTRNRKGAIIIIKISSKAHPRLIIFYEVKREWNRHLGRNMEKLKEFMKFKEKFKKVYKNIPSNV